MEARLLYIAGLLFLSSVMAEQTRATTQTQTQVQNPMDDAEDAVSECDYYCKTSAWTSQAVSWVGTVQRWQFFLMILIITCFSVWSLYFGGVGSLKTKTEKPKVPNECEKDVVFEVPPELDFEAENGAEPPAPVEEKQVQCEKGEKMPLLLYRGNVQYPREDTVAKYGGLDAVHDAIDARSRRGLGEV